MGLKRLVHGRAIDAARWCRVELMNPISRGTAMQPITVNAALAAQVLDIAREAGVAIMSVYQELCRCAAGAKPVLVTYKADDSPLTRADLLAVSYTHLTLPTISSV